MVRWQLTGWTTLVDMPDGTIFTKHSPTKGFVGLFCKKQTIKEDGHSVDFLASSFLPIKQGDYAFVDDSTIRWGYKPNNLFYIYTDQDLYRMKEILNDEDKHHTKRVDSVA